MKEAIDTERFDIGDHVHGLDGLHFCKRFHSIWLYCDPNLLLAHSSQAVHRNFLGLGWGVTTHRSLFQVQSAPQKQSLEQHERRSLVSVNVLAQHVFDGFQGRLDVGVDV